MKIVISFLILLMCVGCQEASTHKTHDFLGNAMTMDYKVLVGSSLSVNEQTIVQKIIDETFHEIDLIYNKWNPDSELSKLNRLKKEVVVNLSTELELFLKTIDRIVTLTEGRFDPTINHLQEFWKTDLPTTKEIEKQMQAVGWSKIHIQNGTFYKDDDDLSLDLGGIVKGFAVDLLVDKLNSAGFPNVFVEWGGEIKTSGVHPDRRPWHIFVSRLGNPDENQAIAHIDLESEGAAIATSGDYFQNWTVNSKTYFHIFNPKTGHPLEITPHSIASVSVLSHSCLLSDAIATALMLFPNRIEAAAWAEKLKEEYPEMQFWIITR